MSWVGTPFIFSFRMLSPSVGAMAKNCIVEFDGGHFIFGRSNFYLNSGDRITPLLPTKMRDHVYGIIDGEYAEKSFAIADYSKNEILACFVSSDSTSTQIDKAVVWNYANGTFGIRDLPDLAHICPGVIDNPLAFSTWAAATATWATAYGSWAQSMDKFEDTLVFASPTDTKLYRNRSGNKEDTTDMTSFVYGGTQMSTEEAGSWKGPYEFNPNTQSKVSCQATGKLYGVKFESSTDTQWQLAGLEFEVEDAGRRGSRSY